MALGRIVTLVSVAALGAGALAAASPHGHPVAVRSAALTPAAAHPTSPTPVHRGHEARPAPHVPARPAAPARTAGKAPAASSPAPAPRATARRAAAPARWLPRGIGMCIYQWGKTGGGNAHRVVHRAEQVGLSTLYVRTGSSWDGFTGARTLHELLPATHGTSLHVVAWDFPRLWHPVHDARRLARAARVDRHSTGPHVAAVAPDIETPAEGTFNAAWRVRTYMRALRRMLPADVTILGTVPWPSRYRIADYPYGAVAAHSDALVPMAYWYNNPPAMVTARSISYLSRFHKPVQPVGQGYDGKLDVPSLRHNHLGREVPRFFRTAHAHGARAVSLWSWQAAPPPAWKALERAHHLFPAHH